MKKLSFLIVAFLFCALVNGQTYHGVFIIDSPVMGLNTAASGMGELSIIPPDNTGNAVYAPHALPGKAGFFASVNFGLLQANESRAMPLYDTFDEIVAWTAYTNNSNIYEEIAVFVGYRFAGDWLPAISAGYAPIFDTRFDYKEQIRDKDTDTLIAIMTIESSGILAGPVVAISEDFLDFASIGASVTFISGELSIKRSEPITLRSNLPDYENWEWSLYSGPFFSEDISGTYISISAIGRPTKRIEIGLSFNPGIDLGNSEYPDLPGRFGFGLGYRPPGHIISRIAAEVECVQYSLDEAMNNAWNFRFGLEHKLPSGIPLRIGAYQNEIPSLDPVVRTGLTIGSGLNIGIVSIDLSAAYQMSKYKQHDLFPESWIDESAGDRTEFDEVTENILFGSVGINVQF